jgi:hypothetical protein
MAAKIKDAVFADFYKTTANSVATSSASSNPEIIAHAAATMSD